MAGLAAAECNLRGGGLPAGRQRLAAVLAAPPDLGQVVTVGEAQRHGLAPASRDPVAGKRGEVQVRCAVCPAVANCADDGDSNTGVKYSELRDLLISKMQPYLDDSATPDEPPTATK